MSSSKNLGRNLKRIRLDRGETVTEFANTLKIGKTTLYNYERGTKQFSSATLDQIAAALEMEPSELISRAPSKHLFRSLLQTIELFSALPGEKRTRALYHLEQITTLLAILT